METINESIVLARQPVAWVVDLMQRTLAIPDNSFQRRYVWAEKHQIKLIESILLDYPIPEIYLWQKDEYLDTGDSIYNIIDGQQRLGAILQFVNNGFALKTHHLDGANKGKSFSGKRFSELNDEWLNRFWSYKIHFRLVRPSVSYEEIVKMFLRLNSVNLTLNPQELRNAEFSGKFIELAAELASNEVFKKHELFSNNDIRRMKDIEFTSEILTFFRRGITEDTTQETINRMYDLYNNEYDEAYDDKQWFNSIAYEVSIIINNDTKVQSFLRKQTHLYALFAALYVNLKKGKTLILKQVDLYKDFVLANTDSAMSKLQQPALGMVEEYKLLSSTGTKKKLNRMRRVDLIINILSI